MAISEKKATEAEAQRWAERCIPGTYWDLDFTYYGPDSVVFPKSYSKWADFIRNMEVRPDDVWVVSFPKCGTTWTQEMVWLLANGLNYEEARANFLEERFPFLEIDAFFRIPPKWNGTTETNKPPTSVEIVDSMDKSRPRYIKSHLPLSLLPKELLEKKAKIIYVARNPKDACVSYYHHNVLIPGYTGTMEDFAETFITDNAVFSPYWPNVREFYERRHLSNVLFITYEDMKKDLASVITKTASFLGTQISPEQRAKLEDHLSFEQMKKNPSVNWERIVQAAQMGHNLKPKTQFLRKGQVDSWKDEMSPKWIQEFDGWISKNGIPGLYPSS